MDTDMIDTRSQRQLLVVGVVAALGAILGEVLKPKLARKMKVRI